MTKKILSLLALFSLHFLSVSGNSDFGYISYSTANVGDYIQAIAAKRFLPENSIAIDREFIGEFSHPSKVKTIVNGWYMHTRDLYWHRNDVEEPKKSWPPSLSIDPLLISIHFTKEFLPQAMSAEGIEYLKQHGPVGTRDESTLHELQQRDIPCFFSGCLTLTLENVFKEREDIIYVVDLDEECVKFIKSQTKSKVKVLHHGLKFLPFLSNNQRLAYAQRLLEKYAKAKCVVTGRLHATMPCLALETPVLLIKGDSDRYAGLKELVWNCQRDELLKGKVDYNFNAPPANPKTYLPIRENLIKRVTEWVEKNSK